MMKDKKKHQKANNSHILHSTLLFVRLLSSAFVSQWSAFFKVSSVLHAPLVLPPLQLGFYPFSHHCAHQGPQCCLHGLIQHLLFTPPLPWLAGYIWHLVGPFQEVNLLSLCALYDMTYSCVLLCVSDCSFSDPLLLTTDIISNKDPACPLLS